MAWDPPWDLGSVMRELYLLSLRAVAGDSTATGGGGDWTASETEARTEQKGRRGLGPLQGIDGLRATRGVGIARAACMAARGGGEWRFLVGFRGGKW